GIDSNQLIYQSQSIFPSLDSLQEFKVQTHNFAAEFGRGAVHFVTTTKSGTKDLHGAAYDYLRNSVLNANDFFSNRAGGAKQPFRYNQFGANVGGPIYIPKVYDGRKKSFFFFSYEGTRLRQTFNAFARVPDAAWLKGDFSGLTNPDG